MQKIFLWDDETLTVRSGSRPSIVPFLLEDDKIHPAVLVIPGGGYGCVCESSEGSPIALKFNELGYHAFVLDYRTAPDHWPAPQLDGMRAMKLIRANAEMWRVDPGKVAACGFSAGAHLAGSLGILCDALDASAGDAADGFSHIPDVMILCYGVLAFAPWSHLGTQNNLLGEDFAGSVSDYSLPEHVSEKTPPAFLMHTVCDQAVAFKNSMVFAEAMAAHKRPCQLALNYWGDHGMLLGIDTLDAVNWPVQAHAFMQSLEMMKNDPDFRERYTNAYQSMAENRVFSDFFQNK